MASPQVHIADTGQAPYDCVSCPAGVTVGAIVQHLQQGFGKGILCHYDNQVVGDLVPLDAPICLSTASW
jgi:hypothetical protein